MRFLASNYDRGQSPGVPEISEAFPEINDWWQHALAGLDDLRMPLHRDHCIHFSLFVYHVEAANLVTTCYSGF